MQKKDYLIMESARQLLGPFKLEIKDVPEEVPYKTGNHLKLPENLSDEKIRQIGISVRLWDKKGFSLGDLLLWLEIHPDAPVAYEDMIGILLQTGLKRRTLYNYKCMSNCFPATERDPSLSRAHHDAVRALPHAERQELFKQARQDRWTHVQLRNKAKLRQLALQQLHKDVVNNIEDLKQLNRSEDSSVVEKHIENLLTAIAALRDAISMPPDCGSLPLV